MQRTWPEWALSYLYTFRAVVVGTCLLLAGLGWTLHIGWLLAAGMCIAAGEFVESTYYIMVLKWAERTGRLVVHGPSAQGATAKSCCQAGSA